MRRAKYIRLKQKMLRAIRRINKRKKQIIFLCCHYGGV